MHFFLFQVILYNRKDILRSPYRHTPVLYNVQNVHLYRVEIVQYRDDPIQLGQLIMYYTPKKVLPFAFFYLTRPSKAGNESIPENIRVIKDLGTWIHKIIYGQFH